MHRTKSLKEKWLNLMLHFSAFINFYKLKLIEESGPKIIIYGFFILLLELVNFFISLPAYAFIKPEFFAGNDQSAIKIYKLRRIVSLSVLGGMVFAVVLWIVVGIFGVALFPSRSQASTASWDFNNSLAYHYDPTKIQIVDGTVIFKATQAPIIVPADTTPIVPPAPVTEPDPTPIPAPIPEPTPAPAPTPTPTPTAPSSPILFNSLKSILSPATANASGNVCSATLEPIAPLIVASFDHWISFSEIANKNSGDIQYQLSINSGISWLYWNGSVWIDANATNFNSVNDINSNIRTLPIILAGNNVATLSFRARFTSDCTQDVTLLSLTADYAEHTTIVSVTNPTNTNIIQTTTSEENPSVIAVTDSIISTTTNTNSNTSITVPSIPAIVSIVDTSPIIVTNTTPIAFSIHAVINTTGTSGHTLYSVPGLFTLEEGPDNSLVVKVTNTSLEQTILATPSGASGNISIDDHIVVLTYDGSNLKLYIDGAISATLNTPIVIAPPAQVSTSIGCVSAGVILHALSLAQINANYIECGNNAPMINITSATQKTNATSVAIRYTIVDRENNFVTLTKYEYSRTGAFTGEEKTMTEASLDVDSSGTGGLNGSTSGTSHTFVWDAKTDLPNIARNVYVRLKGTDGLLASTNEIFGPFHIDTLVPIIVEENVQSIPNTTDVVINTQENNNSDGFIPSIISNIFGGSNNTIETTISSRGGFSVGGSSSLVSKTSNNQNINTSDFSTSTPNAPKGVIITSITPTSATVAFTSPIIKNLSEARESAVIAKPVVNTVNKSVTGGSITFKGKGIPGSKVALFIHSDQVVVYTTDVNDDGEWGYKHDQTNVELAPGEHSVFAVTYDAGSKIKSKPSLIETFIVKQNIAAVVLSYVDLPTTLLTLVVLLFGTVYIYSRRRKHILSNPIEKR